MNTRSKLVAAVLGLTVAIGTFGEASARTVTKITRAHGVAVTKIVTHRPHRLLAGPRIVKHVRIVHRAPVVAAKKVVRIDRRPHLARQAFAHRLIVRKTVIR